MIGTFSISAKTFAAYTRLAHNSEPVEAILLDSKSLSKYLCRRDGLQKRKAAIA
jgi:DNA-directed RNA polymerase subunit N (RpoN/RPB10)